MAELALDLGSTPLCAGGADVQSAICETGWRKQINTFFFHQEIVWDVMVSAALLRMFLWPQTSASCCLAVLCIKPPSSWFTATAGLSLRRRQSGLGLTAPADRSWIGLRATG